MSTSIGDRFRGRREELGYTLKKLAELTGKGVTTLNHLEITNKIPSVNLIREVGKVLEFTDIEIENFIETRTEMKLGNAKASANVSAAVPYRDLQPKMILKSKYIVGLIDEIETLESNINNFIKNHSNIKNIEHISNGKRLIVAIYYFDKE